MSTMIGRKKALLVSEADDIAEVQKDVVAWSDIYTFVFIPIFESKDVVAITMQ
jgi:hypothetical protein